MTNLAIFPFKTRPAVLALAAAALLAACKPAPAPEPGTPPATGASVPAAAAPGSASAAPAEALRVPTDATDAYTLAANGQGFSTGPMMSANTVYVFFDTTCPHCAHLWQAVQGMGASKLKVVWMPIGLLRPQSGPQGATILAAADPAAAMAANEASVLANGKGIEVPGTLDEATLDKVKANTALFRQLNADSVPLIVYRNAKTGEVGQHAGAVDADRLSTLAGL